jgi:uncharacterized protein
MLLDTSGLLCLHHSTEPLHTQAVSAYQRASTRLIHNYIIAEYIALAHARRFPRPPILSFVADLLNHSDIEMIWVDEALHNTAIELLRERPDKGYSLCDSVSFVIMRQRDISEALSTDRHFDQERFIRLLQPNT